MTWSATERLRLMGVCNTKYCPSFCLLNELTSLRYQGAVFFPSIAAASSCLPTLKHFKPWQHAARHISHAQLLAMSNSPSLPSPPSATPPPVAVLALVVWG